MLATVVIAGLLNLRLAHLVSTDTITKPLRDWLYDRREWVHAGQLHRRRFVVWLNDLVECPLCTGVWLGVLSWSMASRTWPWAWGIDGLVGWGALCGFQAGIDLTLTAIKAE